VAGTFDEVIELLKTTAKPWRMTFEACHYMTQPLVELYAGVMVVLKVSCCDIGAARHRRGPLTHRYDPGELRWTVCAVWMAAAWPGGNVRNWCHVSKLERCTADVFAYF
jgi:hypothetical protein